MDVALRPGAEEIIRGVQQSLRAHVLPEVKTAYATAQVSYAIMLLGALAAEWDGAAQRLVEDNAALRGLAARAAEATGIGDAALVAELRAAAVETDRDVRITTLSAANDRLRALLSRLILAGDTHGLEPASALREDSMQELRESVQRRLTGALRT